ncbi:hypothetical protein [Streptomyces sp. NPDC002587]
MSIRTGSASPVRSHRAETYRPGAAIGARRPEDDGLRQSTGRKAGSIGPIFGERRFALIAAVCDIGGIGGANPASSTRPAACWWFHARKGAEAPG